MSPRCSMFHKENSFAFHNSSMRYLLCIWRPRNSRIVLFDRILTPPLVPWWRPWQRRSRNRNSIYLFFLCLSNTACHTFCSPHGYRSGRSESWQALLCEIYKLLVPVRVTSFYREDCNTSTRIGGSNVDTSQRTPLVLVKIAISRHWYYFLCRQGKINKDLYFPSAVQIFWTLILLQDLCI